MKCKYCEKQFNNMRIGESHIHACPNNPNNKNKSEYELYLQVQKYAFKKDYFSAYQGRERKLSYLKKIMAAIKFKNNNIKDFNVLIIGAANNIEIDILKNYGIIQVVAIDLVSHLDNIIEMDMHDLKFDDNSFDLVTMSHSLEHAKDYKKVIKGIDRVLKSPGFFACEIPVNYKVNDVDRHDFVNAGSLHKSISAILEDRFCEILLLENIKLDDQDNFCATDVVQYCSRIIK